jgi:DNA-binding transcriptional ArsR family regulator
MDSCDLLCLDFETAERVRASLDPPRTAHLADTLKTFADPTRLLIAQALVGHELCGCDLGWITGQSDKTISYHLGRLRRDGVVHSHRDGKVVFASLTDHGRAVLHTLQAAIG